MPADKKTTKKAQVKVKDLKAKKDVKGGALFIKLDAQNLKISPSSTAIKLTGTQYK